MAKQKVTVSIDGTVWAAFKNYAWRLQLEAGQNLSVSQFLENMIRAKVEIPVTETDVCEQSVDSLKTASEARVKQTAKKAETSWQGGYSKNAQLGRKGK